MLAVFLATTAALLLPNIPDIALGDAPSLTRTSMITMRGGPPPHLKKNKKSKPPKVPNRAPPAPPPPPTNEALRDAHMATVREAVDQHAHALITQLKSRGFGIVDNFLPPSTIAHMRSECEGLRLGGSMVRSQSTRWDETTGSVQTYQKANVLSTNVVGGEAYHLSPRLVEYCVQLVSSLPLHVNANFDGARMSSTVHTNKLAVCLGDGSEYAKHYDNSGGEDARKLVRMHRSKPPPYVRTPRPLDHLLTPRARVPHDRRFSSTCRTSGLTPMAGASACL